jgi:hypothetical protein
MRIVTIAGLVASVSLPSLLVASLDAQARRPEQTRAVPLEVICAPSSTLTLPDDSMKIMGGTERRKQMFGTGETVLVNAGTSQGLRAGQHFFVRRIVQDRHAEATADVQPKSIHTAGWITIVETQAYVSVATVAEACDGIQDGDYLQPLVLPEAAAAAAAGVPDFEDSGRIILGDDRRQLGAAGSLMVVDRGTDHGVRAGQRLTIFRTTVNGTGPVVSIGEAVIISTQAESSVMRIQQSREAIQVGDKIALHR